MLPFGDENNHITRFALIFIGNIIIILGLSTEIMDISEAYFKVTINPRMALLIIVWLQAIVGVISLDHGLEMKAKTLLVFVVMIPFFIVAEIPNLANHIFQEFATFLRNSNTILIIVTIIVMALGTAYLDYIRQQNKGSESPA